MIRTYFIIKKKFFGIEKWCYYPAIIYWQPSRWSGLGWYDAETRTYKGFGEVKKGDLIRYGIYPLDKTKNYHTEDAARSFIKRHWNSVPKWERKNYKGFTERLSLHFEDAKHVVWEEMKYYTLLNTETEQYFAGGKGQWGLYDPERRTSHSIERKKPRLYTKAGLINSLIHSFRPLHPMHMWAKQISGNSISNPPAPYELKEIEI